jgi:hypothetical protein
MEVDNAFLVYNLLFSLLIIGVSIVMFFCGLCFYAFISLVLLVDGLPSLLFVYIGFFNMDRIHLFFWVRTYNLSHG